MGYPETFEGFCVDSPKTWTTYKKHTLEPKPFAETDVDVEIECCGVCDSDVLTVTGAWGDFQGPLCVGHEIVGRAVRVGNEAKDVKQGDRVGVGAQVGSCLECDICKSQNENYCPKKIDTYNAKYPDGSTAHGGWASHIRAHWYYVFPIPSAIHSAEAAPLLCAGVTTYSPLVRAGIGPGKRVGVLGIGGLGHMALQWSRALGAETYALTHSPHKKADALLLGAHDVVVTTDPGWTDAWQFKFDLILDCTDKTHQFDVPKILGTLGIGGQYHILGAGDAPLAPLPAGVFMPNAAKMTGSHLGDRQEVLAMLDLAARTGIKPSIETLPLGEEGCREAVERLKENKVHYRFTLTDFDKAFGG
ncbi:hypothetical protein ACRALDRAFT_1082910 [Sodiomyces alcalophilus JCM 7366]|uniref:uncharacterized protein n=1 Tax=Sodiomyces alcalophilus JCM 7366 TaxID=591952 RepID=UPI0039B59C45